MYIRFLCISLIALSVNVASSSFAYTPLNLRISAPALTESLREHLRTTWTHRSAYSYYRTTRWSIWGDTTYTNLQVEESEVSTEMPSGMQDGDLKEKLEAITILGGVNFHVFPNFLVGFVGSYQTSDSTQTFGQTSAFSAFTNKDTTESFGVGGYLGYRFQTITLHIAGAGWYGEIDNDDFDGTYDTRDLFLSVGLNQEFTVADDALSLGWHVSGSWSNRTYGEDFKFENKNSFTRGEAGIKISYHLSQSERPQIEIFALANANYDTFSDEQSIRYDDTGLMRNNIRILQQSFSFTEEQLGVNVGGGVEFAFTDGLKLHLFAQYSDLFRDSYDGYSLSGQLSYTWMDN